MGQDVEQDTELLQIFLEESAEQLDGIEADLLAIERAGADVDDELVNKTFRAVHSVKGGASFFYLVAIQQLAHAMENVLGAVRSRQLVVGPAVAGALLDGADHLVRMLEDLDLAKDPGCVADVVARIEASANEADAPPATPAATPEPAAPDGPTFPEWIGHTDGELDMLRKEAGEGAKAYRIAFDAVSDIDETVMPLEARLELLTEIATVVQGRLPPRSADDLSNPDSLSHCTVDIVVFSRDAAADLAEALVLPERCVQSMEAEPEPETPAEPAAEVTPAETSAPVAAVAAPAASKPAKRADANKENASIRVRLALLDRLMTLAGELVLTRNQLVQSVQGSESPVVEATHRIDHITTELQDAIMSTRMQSVGVVFNKFRRVVRDLAKSLGKEVELVIEGEDVELDKTVIESIGDPLTHLVRNALDHGLETPAEREASGKGPKGLLRLSATHRAGNVIIEIQDDGRGVNVAKVKAKAAERGLFSSEELAVMNRQAALRLIMRPGFSTAAAVTDLSGRGVGMDVVASNLKKLGGSIDLESEEGQGSTMRVKLPLTLAIIPALLVTEEGRRFAIPQANLVELHRIPAREVTKRIRVLGESEVLSLRGELLPIVRLRDVLAIQTRTFVDEEGQRRPDSRTLIGDHRREGGGGDERRRSVSSAVHVAVVAAGDLNYGLVLESWQETSEIVVKPLGRHLRDCPGYAGATILGDGSSALILDVEGMGRTIHDDLGGDEQVDPTAGFGDLDQGGAQLSALLLRGFGGGLFSIPLELVTRVERTMPDRIQNMMGRLSLRYHGGSLPLVAVDALVGGTPVLDKPGYVAVFEHAGHEVGVFTADLLDVVETHFEVDDLTMRSDGVLGSFHLGSELVLLLDTLFIAQTILREEASRSGRGSGNTRILLVEPSGFLRRTTVRFLDSLGWPVEALPSEGEAEFALLDADDSVALVLDVDSAPQHSFDFIERLRDTDEGRDVYIVGTSSHLPADMLARGRQAGIDHFVSKMDLQELADHLERIDNALGQVGT